MIGAIGNSITTDSHDCASRLLRVNEATAVIRPAPSGTNGSITAKIARTTRGPKFADMPSASSGMNCNTTPNAARVSSSEIDMNADVASILPTINSARRTGNASNGSSEPRSRSPAVVSIAR
jgi:hypothetical protein